MVWREAGAAVTIERSDSRKVATDCPPWPLKIASESIRNGTYTYNTMACDLCNCDDHHNQPCSNCLNCVGHYAKDCDYDKTHTQHTELAENSPTVTTKPHYRYDARTGVLHPKKEPARKIVY